MKISYFPGCALKSNAKNLEATAIMVAERLGVEMIELPRWNCCGAVHSLVSDDLMRRAAPIRDLLRVKQTAKKYELSEFSVVTLCSMCFNSLKQAAIFAEHNPDKLEIINAMMEEEEDHYDGGVKVKHFLELLREIGPARISSSVVKPLKGLRVAPYYGCLLLKPRGIGIDDPESPTIMKDILQALGVEVVDFPYKNKCCGSYQTVDKKNLVVKLTYEILSYASKSGADVIALSCPLCFFNLDERQREIKKSYSGWREIPILYFTQLMALAFGFKADLCGFNLHYVDPTPILVEKGLIGGV